MNAMPPPPSPRPEPPLRSARGLVLGLILAVLLWAAIIAIALLIF
jgi:hypothetical protein